MVNLAAQARDAEIRLPDGFHPADREGPVGAGPTTVALKQYGVVRLKLVRQHNDDIDSERARE